MSWPFKIPECVFEGGKHQCSGHTLLNGLLSPPLPVRADNKKEILNWWQTAHLDQSMKQKGHQKVTGDEIAKDPVDFTSASIQHLIVLLFLCEHCFP